MNEITQNIKLDGSLYFDDITYANVKVAIEVNGITPNSRNLLKQALKDVFNSLEVKI